MKNILLILLTLIINTKFSYASFPIKDNVNKKISSEQTNKIKEYHTNLIRIGIDCSSNKYVNCSNSISKKSKKLLIKKRNIWINFFIIMVILSIGTIFLLFSWMENFNKSGGIGVG